MNCEQQVYCLNEGGCYVGRRVFCCRWLPFDECVAFCRAVYFLCVSSEMFCQCMGSQRMWTNYKMFAIRTLKGNWNKT